MPRGQKAAAAPAPARAPRAKRAAAPVAVASSPFPWDPIAAVLVELLRHAVDARDCGRGILMRAVRTLPLTCREARAHLRQQPCAPWLILYQLHVFDIGIFHSFYDNVPSGIDFDAGSHDHTTDCVAPGCVAPAYSADGKAHVQVDKLLRMRVRVARLLDKPNGDESVEHHDFKVLGPLKRFLATEGLPNDLPRVVRQFVGFLRYQNYVSTQALSTHFAPDTLSTYFAPDDMAVLQDLKCSRKGCNRRASAWPPGYRDDKLTLDSTLGYWELCRTGSPKPKDDHELWTPFTCCNLTFCSWTCASQTMAEFSRLVRCCRDDGSVLNTLEFVRAPRGQRGAKGPRTHGERQLAVASINAVPPARLHRAALERNELLRQLMARSCVAKKEPTHLPMNLQSAAALRQELVMALNVDTALLYAASVICELAPGSRPFKTLPGCPAWRKQWGAESCYLGAILKIRNLYLQELKTNPGQTTHLITSCHTQPRWLQRVKDCALTLF